jgi:hypothetical protein
LNTHINVATKAFIAHPSLFVVAYEYPWASMIPKRLYKLLRGLNGVNDSLISPDSYHQTYITVKLSKRIINVVDIPQYGASK